MHMMNVSREYLWPTEVGIYETTDPAPFLAAYEAAYLPPNDTPRGGDERRVMDILDQCPQVASIARDCVLHYLGPYAHMLDPEYNENRALLIEDRAYIQTHADDREGDVTAVIFLSGSGEGMHYNTRGNPNFQLENPSGYAEQYKLPFENRHAFHINPRAGLIIVFPSRIPHNQQPFFGPDKMHIQIVSNYRVRVSEEYHEKYLT